MKWRKFGGNGLGRVFVLAIDGLEYYLVKKWQLENLMQKTYGKFVLSHGYYHADEHVPYTPIIWASFITGLPPEQHEVQSIFTYGQFLDFFRNLPFVKLVKGKRKVLWKLGMKPRLVDKRDLARETIFDVIKPSVAVDVPAYNEPTDVNLRLGEILMSRGVKEYVKEVWKVYEERKRRVFESMEKDWKLFMAYFKIADLLGHVYMAKNLKSLRKVYFVLDELAYELKRRSPENTVFLIVSDHGMEPQPDGTGNHSSHGFYSMDFETDWQPRDIIDFPKKIKELITQNV